MLTKVPLIELQTRMDRFKAKMEESNPDWEREGMAFALEPKKGIKGMGMVGIENTFLVTPGGGGVLPETIPG